MSAPCPRLFEVEALRDGRLQGAELVRFKTHLGACADCTREARALQALAAALRTPSPLPTPDQLHVRRERTRLLAAFDAKLVPAPRHAKVWFRLVAALAAISLLAGLGFALWPARPFAAPVARAPRAPDPVTVRADGSARWSRHTEPQLDRIVLQSGALSIHVEHTQPQRRLIVVLPDGELEDIGTTFSVSADAGQTTRVHVQAGSVVLRLRGKPPIALGAGDAWIPPSPEPSASPTPSAAPPATPPSTARATPVARGVSSSARSVDVTAADPAADFRAAMSAFNDGDNTGAAARFGVFVSKHPSDPRAQDAAYLRILALQRSGNSAATQQAARDYLKRYPAGFRHAEAEALAR